MARRGRKPSEHGAGRRTRVAIGAALAVMLIAGCGPDARREQARRTLHLANRALARIETNGHGESTSEDASATIEPAYAEALRWLERTERAYETWRHAGPSFAYETMAPCLGSALGVLRERLARHGRPIPESLRQAEALARTASDMPCARRPRGTADARSRR